MIRKCILNGVEGFIFFTMSCQEVMKLIRPDLGYMYTVTRGGCLKSPELKVRPTNLLGTFVTNIEFPFKTINSSTGYVLANKNISLDREFKASELHELYDIELNGLAILRSRHARY